MAKVQFTAGRVRDFACPAGKSQAFLWDAEVAGLGLRATPNGKPAYVFQRQHEGKTVRQTIGSPEAWTIEQARTRARELQRLMDTGHNPAEVKRDAAAAKVAERQAGEAEAEAQRQQEAREAVTVGKAWAAYVAERSEHWGERHRADNFTLSQPGGEPHKRKPGQLTKPGPLAVFMPMRLMDLTPELVEAWARKEAKTRPARLRLALRLLKAFMRWCAAHKDYRGLADANAASSKRARETAGRMKPGSDVLQREQLPAWFAAVRSLGNPVHAAYLQTLLLTGARPGEAVAIRWEDVNFQWRGLTIRDKVEGERVIPLTPYVAQLLAALPRRGPLVFQGTKAAPISNPSESHGRACTIAGIGRVTLHGLRRSFGTLSEWLEIPAGVVAQIQGHKPSATAEKHYRVRPLDLLRVHHEAIEAWMLEQAGVQFTPQAEPGKLRAVK